MRIVLIGLLLTASAFAQLCSNPAEKPVAHPEAGGMVMCHDDALEFENVSLKLQNLEVAAEPLAEKKAMISAKILQFNPDWIMNPQTGHFMKRTAAPMPPVKPEGGAKPPVPGPAKPLPPPPPPVAPPARYTH